MEGEAQLLLSRGRAALAGFDWETARACYADALALGDDPEALDGLGQALYWQGDYPHALRLRERAYTSYRQRGDHARPGGWPSSSPCSTG